MKQKIKDFIVENFMYGLEPSGLNDEASLLGTGIIDSTGIMELIAFVEREFEIRVEDDEMLPENLDSIGNISRYLTRKKQAAASVATSLED